MSDDKQMEFYFQNYEVIDQWIDLRQRAIRELDEALMNAVQQIVMDRAGPPVPVEVRNRERVLLQFALGGARRDQQCIELSWDGNELFRPGAPHEWPVVALVAQPQTDLRLRAELFQASKQFADSSDFERSGTGWWVRHKQMRPSSLPFDIGQHAQHCAEAFFETWDAVGEKLTVVLERAGSPTVQ